MKQRNDGRYVMRITLPGGKIKDVYGYSAESVKIKAKEIHDNLDKGIDIANDLTVAEWCYQWLAEYKKSVRHNTQVMYQNAIDVHIVPVIGQIELKDIKPIDIQRTLNGSTLKSVKDDAGNTISVPTSYSLQEKVLRTLRQVFSSAVTNRYIAFNPCDGIKITQRRETGKMKYLSKDQRTILLDSVKGTRAELFTAIGLFGGLRREETLGLMWSDIDLKKKQISICRSVTFIHNRPEISEQMKTPESKRVIPILNPLCDILKEAKHESPYVVVDTQHRVMSEIAYKRMWQSVESKVNFSVTSHMLRHTYCTILYEAGIDLKTAQYLMGHSDIKTTAKIYTHIEKNQIVKAANKINAYFVSQSKKSVKRKEKA